MRQKTLTFAGLPATRVGLRLLGAALLIFVGADHYYQYSVKDYSVIPTIGTLFLLNFISATVIGVMLLVPVERFIRRLGSFVVRLEALSGFGIAATSLAALLVSEQTKLFGFMEYNYRPEIVAAIASEAAAAIVLGLFLATTFLRRSGTAGPRRRRPGAPRPAMS
jgi:hypothetical protein